MEKRELGISSAKEKKAVIRCLAEMFGCRAGTPSKSSLFSHGPPNTSLRHPGRLKRGQRAATWKTYFIVGPVKPLIKIYHTLRDVCEQVEMLLEAMRSTVHSQTILKENKIWSFRYFHRAWTSAHIGKSDRKAFTDLQNIHFFNYSLVWFQNSIINFSVFLLILVVPVIYN